MRELTESEVEQLVEALRHIASFHNDAADQSDGGQAAARDARAVLERLGLLHRNKS